MKKLKNFFLNKVLENENTTFSDVINSYGRGFFKIFILFVVPSMITSFMISLLSDVVVESIMGMFFIIYIIYILYLLVYILFNRLPNQIKIHKNYINTKKQMNRSKFGHQYFYYSKPLYKKVLGWIGWIFLIAGVGNFIKILIMLSDGVTQSGGQNVGQIFFYNVIGIVLGIWMINSSK